MQSQKHLLRASTVTEYLTNFLEALGVGNRRNVKAHINVHDCGSSSHFYTVTEKQLAGPSQALHKYLLKNPKLGWGEKRYSNPIS